MKRHQVVLGVLICMAVLWSGEARAEQREDVVGIGALMVLPRINTSSSTGFAAVGWGVQGFAAYGVLQDLYVEARFGLWDQGGNMSNVTLVVPSGTYRGNLFWTGEAYKAELGLRYKVFSGFNLAPYLEAYGGYQWTTFTGQDLRNAAGGSYGLPIGDVGQGAGTAGGGVALEYRLFNVVLLSASCLYTKVWNSLYAGDLTIGIAAAFTWTSVATGF